MFISIKRSVPAIVLAALIAACASESQKEPAKAAPLTASVPQPAATPLPPRPAVQAAPAVATAVRTAAQPAKPINSLNDPSNILSKRSIYFDFDSSEVRSDFRPLIEAHARYLREHSGARITIQGNSDERGGREYNISLGQRRAEAVIKTIALLGVAERQMEAISFGEEKPKSPGHNEDAWAENRRSDIVYLRIE